jgi:hypothetical protein
MQRGTTLTRPDLPAGINAYQEEHGYIVEEGNGFNTGLIIVGPDILGKFNSTTDSFDRLRHKTHYSVNFSRAIQEKAAKIKMTKVQEPNTGPLVTAIRDGVSGLTDGTEYKATTLVENKPSRLIVMLPPLPSGAYTLEVRTHFIGNATPGKQLRRAQFAKPLNI